MSYKYCLALTVFLIFKYNANASSLLLECIRFSIQSEILFLLLVYLYLKLIHNTSMPSLALIEEPTERFAYGGPDRAAPVSCSSLTKKCDAKNFLAGIRPKNGFIDGANGAGTAYSPRAKVADVKRKYMRQDDEERNRCHNEQLENDKCLFTPGKVSRIAERFQKNSFPSEPPSPPSRTTPKVSKKRVEWSDQAREVPSSLPPLQPLSECISYSWVFGDCCVPNVSGDLDTQQPVDEVDFPLGELRSFKGAYESRGQAKDIFDEVLTCNVIDQRTCDWRSVRNELKSNLDKLKPVAIIDPLTLPIKSNGFAKVIANVPSPLYSAKNTNETNGRYSDVEPYAKKAHAEPGLGQNCELPKAGAYAGELKNVSGASVERPLSPILENDSYTSTVSTSSSFSGGGEISAKSYPKERKKVTIDRDSFPISPQDLYPYDKYDAEADENDNVWPLGLGLDQFQSVSSNRRDWHSLCSISLPLASPLEKCTSECQVRYQYRRGPACHILRLMVGGSGRIVASANCTPIARIAILS